MPSQTIIATANELGYGVITLDRPERRNAISILMRQEISECLSSWQDDDRVDGSCTKFYK